jgi:tetratricopeptide (TPR) repeat protein
VTVYRAFARILWLVCVLCLSQRTGAAERQDPAVSVPQIQAALERGDVDSAKSAVEAGLREYPNDPALLNFAGVIAAQRGDWITAETHFREAIRLAPRAVPPYENLGRLYQVRSVADHTARAKALDVYRALLSVDPANVEGLFQSALLRALAGEFAVSRALLEQLPQAVQGRPQALAVRVADLAGIGDATSSAAAADTLAAHPDIVPEDVLVVLPAFDHVQGDEVLGKLLASLDRRGVVAPGLLRRLAAIQMRRGQFADARGTLDRVASVEPTVPVLVDLARAAANAGDHRGALGYLAHARSLDPQNATVHFLFGVVCVELDLGAEAYESMKKAVALDPENPAVNYMMGVASLHRHESSEAVPYFEKYVRLQPHDPRGRFALGVARFYSNDHGGAQRDLAAITERPETAAGANYFLARITRQSSQLDEARRYVDRAIQANPAYADAWAELGLLQTRAGQYAEAEASLQKALSLDAENYQATVNLTALYTRTRDPRRDAQAVRLDALQKKRGERAQDFLRMIEVVPPSR